MISPDRLRILDRWDRSGLSAAAFAPSAGVSAWTLYAWRRRARRAGASPSAPAFVELAPRDGPARATRPAAGAAFEISLPRGVTLRVAPGADPDELRRVVDALLAERLVGRTALLSLPASVRIFLAVGPCDMRKGFDSLAALVREHFGDDPLSGHLFVFRSRRGDRVKILWWDRDGFAIWMKRLERGTFRVALPESPRRAARVELPRRELMMMLEGIERKDVRKSRRFACAIP